MRKQYEKGQMLLIVVLIMVVALTVGLSIAARSVTNIKIATDDENSQRAFSAAEAGVERLIKSECAIGADCTLAEETFLENNAKFEGHATVIQGNSFLLKGGVAIRQDEGFDVWLSNYSTDASLLYANRQRGKVTVYWGDTSGDCTNAALEIMVLSGSKDNPQLARYALDPCPARQSRNNFTIRTAGTGGTIESRSFPYGFSFNVSNGLLMRIVPLYTNAIMGVIGGDDGSGNIVVFPSQGKQIETTGTAGGTVRKISFVQSYASVPAEFFQYILFSPQ